MTNITVPKTKYGVERAARGLLSPEEIEEIASSFSYPLLSMEEVKHHYEDLTPYRELSLLGPEDMYTFQTSFHIGTHLSLAGIPRHNIVEYDGYKVEKVEEEGPEIEVEVLHSISDDGTPVYYKTKTREVITKSVKVPCKRKKCVEKSLEQFAEDVNAFLDEQTNNVRNLIREKLTSLNTSAPLKGERLVYEEEVLGSVKRCWDSKKGKIVYVVPDEILTKLGFNLRVIRDKNTPFGIDRRPNNFSPEISPVNSDKAFHVCSLTGLFLNGGSFTNSYLYSVENSRVALRSVLGVLPLRKVILTSGDYVHTLEEDVRWVNNFQQYTRAGNIVGISHLGPTSFLKDLAKKGVNQFDFKDKVITFDENGTVTSVTTPEGLKKYIDTSCLPQIDWGYSRRVGQLYFRGDGPQNCIGFIRDEDPNNPSSEPYPGARYYGMEVELECVDPEMDTVIVTKDIAPNVLNSGFTFGTDGSLRNGLEFRSSPQGFNVLKANTHKLFSVLDRSYSKYNRHGQPDEGEGVTLSHGSWKALDSCGLHIHVSRDSLTELQISKLLNFVYHPNNTTFMMYVAGRKNDKYAEMSPKSILKLTPEGKLSIDKRVIRPTHYDRNTKSFKVSRDGAIVERSKSSILYSPRHLQDGRGDKYTAINTLPEKTIEFRMFKGAGSAYEACVRLEFVDSILAFCEVASLSESSDYRNYLRWLGSKESNLSRYRGLLEHLVRAYEDIPNCERLRKTYEQRRSTKAECKKIFSKEEVDLWAQNA